jgi:hypothetical protein
MEELLDKYVNITIKVRNIQNRIYDKKKEIENKLALEKSKKKKDKIIEKFKLFTEKIKQNNSNYKLLVQKQKEIKNKIIKSSTIDIDNSLSYLKSKYEKLSQQKIKIIENSSRNKINNILSSY